MTPTPSQFKGDKIYVFLDVLLFLAGYVVTFAMMGAISDEGYKNAVAQGQKVTPEFIQAITLGFIGCTAVLCGPINVVFWINMLKNKKWAFIATIVLVVIGAFASLARFSGPLMMWTIFSLVVTLAKIIYCSIRLAGKAGPALS